MSAGVRGGGAATTRIAWIAVSVLVAIASLAAASTWRVYGHTWDEPEHLAAGLELLDRGRYEYDVQHPPLGRVLIALGPYLAGAGSLGSPPPDGTPEGVKILYGSGHYNLYLTLARLGTLPFLGLLLVVTWRWATRVAASQAEAVLAVLLVASTPPIIGHGALATLDVPAAATTLLALYCLQRWLLNESWRNAAWLGLASGIAVATKLSAVLFLGAGLVVLAAARRLGAVRLARRAGAPRIIDPVSWGARTAEFAVVVLMAAIVVELAYGAHFVSGAEALARLSNGALPAPPAWLAHLSIPEGMVKLWEAVRAVEWHNATGHESFLLGDVRRDGWWYFYLVALAAKTPLPMLATGPIGLVLLARGAARASDPWRLAPPLLFVSLLSSASLVSHINIGVRHVLILYPFLAIGSAHLLARAWRHFRTLNDRDRAGIGASLVTGVIAVQASTLWTANPDYLPYFNEAIAHPEQVLVDSDLAWGQDLRRLESRLQELRVPSLSFAYLGTADLARETFPPLVRLLPGQRTTGWIAITEMARVHSLTGFAWLDRYSPVERIGKRISLYFIPPGARQGNSPQATRAADEQSYQGRLSTLRPRGSI